MTTHTPAVSDPRTLQLVDALVGAGLVVPEHRSRAAEVVDGVLGSQSAGAASGRRRLAELAGYVGGALVVAAAAVFAADRWGGLGVGQQVGLLAGIAVALAVAAVVVVATADEGVRRATDPVRRRLAGSLLTASASSAGFAVAIVTDDRLGGETSTAAVLGFLTLAVLSLAGYLLAPTVLGQAAVAVGVTTAVMLGLDQVGDVTEVGTGLVLLALGVLWLLATERGLWREVASARVIGCVLAVLGAQLPVLDDQGRWVGYLALALVAVAAFAVYVARPAWPYVAAGVVAVTLVVPEALTDWSDDAIGPAGVMLVAGVALLAASVLGFRLHRSGDRG